MSALNRIAKSSVCALIISACASLYSPAAVEDDEGGAFRSYWEDALHMETRDGSVKLKIGGRIQNDWLSWIDDGDIAASSIGPQNDGTEFRRARMYISGEFYRNVFFKMQFDFEGGDAGFKDVYFGIKPGKGFKIKIGRFKEPFSLEELTSSKYITFMERSLPNVFAPSRNSGIAFSTGTLGGKATLSAGAFRETDDYGTSEPDAYAGTARATALAYYKNDGEKLVHMGISGSARKPSGQTAVFSSGPEIHMADDFVDTGDIASPKLWLAGFEGAVVYGPFSAQAEYILMNIESDTSGDPSFQGYYFTASYFLTGEHRKYKKSAGTFDKTKPNKIFGTSGGSGAWELTARYSALDLNDGPVTGGELADVSAGIAWYLNPNAKVMLNYIYTDLDKIGTGGGITARFQINL